LNFHSNSLPFFQKEIVIFKKVFKQFFSLIAGFISSITLYIFITNNFSGLFKKKVRLAFHKKVFWHHEKKNMFWLRFDSPNFFRLETDDWKKVQIIAKSL